MIFAWPARRAPSANRVTWAESKARNSSRVTTKKRLDRMPSMLRQQCGGQPDDPAHVDGVDDRLHLLAPDPAIACNQSADVARRVVDLWCIRRDEHRQPPHGDDQREVSSRIST